MKLFEAVGGYVFEVAKAAWSAIKTITGFMWSLLLQALKNPVTWGFVTATGGRIAAGNALLGAVVIGIGIIGLAYAVHTKTQGQQALHIA